MRRLAALLLLVLSVASCSRGTEVSFFSDRDLPDELYGGPRQIVGPQRNVQTILYFVRVDDRARLEYPIRLGVATRQQRTPLRQAELVMRQLLGGPTQPEHTGGLGTAIPPETELLSVSVSAGVASVNLSAPFEQAGPELLHQLRVAQVVWTLAELADVTSVRFRVHGVPQPVVDQEGVAHEKVGPARYSNFAPTDESSPIVGGPLPGAPSPSASP